MKIRTGFVSNSSSSSFILIGRLLDNDKLISLKTGNIKAVGKYLYEGTDIFDVDTCEKLAFVKAVNKLIGKDSDLYFSLYEYYYIADGDDELEIDVQELKEKLPKDGKISFFNLDQDYCSSKSIKDLFDKYSDCYDYPSKKDIKKQMSIDPILREKKLKKINKINED